MDLMDIVMRIQIVSTGAMCQSKNSTGKPATFSFPALSVFLNDRAELPPGRDFPIPQPVTEQRTSDGDIPIQVTAAASRQKGLQLRCAVTCWLRRLVL